MMKRTTDCLTQMGDNQTTKTHAKPKHLVAWAIGGVALLAILCSVM